MPAARWRALPSPPRGRRSPRGQPWPASPAVRPGHAHELGAAQGARRANRAHSCPMVRAAEALGEVAKQLGAASGRAAATTDEVRQVREELEQVNRRSPVEVLLDGLTHRRGAHRRESVATSAVAASPRAAARTPRSPRSSPPRRPARRARPASACSAAGSRRRPWGRRCGSRWIDVGVGPGGRPAASVEHSMPTASAACVEQVVHAGG